MAKKRTTRKQARATTTAKPKTRPKKATAAAKAKATVKGALAGVVEAVAKRLPGTDTDALTLLETDHRRLEDLLAQAEKTTEAAVKARRELLKTITRELTTHELIEEKVLYPALETHPETRAIVLEGFQEHHVADVLMKELHGVPEQDEQWAAKFKVLKENLEHHIEEEEGSMFRTARGVMAREELAALGARMSKMKARR